MVWDWERAAAGSPVGMDAVHYCLLVALNARGLERDKAVADTIERAPRVLGQLEVAASDARLVVALELLEMSVRFAEARAAGVDRPARPVRRPTGRPARGPVRWGGSMSVSFSTIISLAPVIAIVAISALIAFVLARGDEVTSTRARR